MPTITLTDRFVDTLKPHPTRRTEYHDTIARGLVLRLTPNGVKSWNLRYRTEDGSIQRLTLGRYPDIGLKGARREVDIHRGTIADGDDPAAAKQVAREIAVSATGDTVADLCKEYMTRYAKIHKRSWREDQRMIDAEILPRWKTRKVVDLTRRDVRRLVTDIADRAPIAGNRYLALVSGLLKYGVKNDWIDANPASHIDKPGKETERARVMTDDEIRLWWRGTATQRPMLCAFTRFRFWTLQRGRELVKIHWSDIDGEWLTLRPELTKNGKPHRVYLTADARAVLDALPRFEDCEFVFPGESLRQPLADFQRIGPYVRAFVERERADAGDTKSPPFDLTPHDMRRTGATRLAESGVPQADIAKVLNHAEGGPKATHVYVRYRFDKEKQVALETWARLLRGILDEKPIAPAVVPFVRR